ncbi:hypothetical protein [Motiliproteus sediminis]|uniref:hypothetical protein n=1 Tax=Motiliproteus sediminis TaxID=1468178 RepID=UPI001AEFD78D|nr:hypothetical protein [Motiliproteus sediminis]
MLRQRLKSLLSWTASLKLTLFLLLLLLVAVINAYNSAEQLFRASTYGVFLTIPLAALALNLTAAIIANPSFRAQPALLLFHLSLLALVGLAGVGQLTNLKAWTEVTTGEWFDGQLEGIQAGPLHRGRADQVRFRNVDFDINYAPGPIRRHTFNRIEWLAEDGSLKTAIIGDQVPLVTHGYRFYTSFNKGFAPQFIWRDRAGRVSIGSVHLPAWPLHEFNQAVEWQLPGSEQRLWIQLEFDEEILSKTEPSTYRTPEEYYLVVRLGDQRHEMNAGDELEIGGGTLVFQGLNTWMGYTVYYDQTRYWMLAACLLAVLSIGWHFWSKFNRTSWQRGEH